MYSYKINNSYTVYVNFAYINDCIKASSKLPKSKSAHHSGSYGQHISVKDAVCFDSTVRVLNLNTQAVQTFIISDNASYQSNIRAISYFSPVGKALMHHCVGEVTTAHTPSGDISYRILSINK